jgi:hypothetical protein
MTTRIAITSSLFLGVAMLLLPSSMASAEVAGACLSDAKKLCPGVQPVFTRKDRVVQSLDALKKQLVSCSHAAKKEFSASEMQDLLKYLNDQFYQFR